MKDFEITRIAGNKKYETLTDQQKIIENFKFNDSFHRIQRSLPASP